ncbi:hypothetical protein EDD16DRAFT_1077255 [Pisolithus croceorrhizus]|nr:hypothetical protein EDD16DRAFT_1077255 [Pisolithus croceorrhizus]
MFVFIVLGMKTEDPRSGVCRLRNGARGSVMKLVCRFPSPEDSPATDATTSPTPCERYGMFSAIQRHQSGKRITLSAFTHSATPVALHTTPRYQVCGATEPQNMGINETSETLGRCSRTVQYVTATVPAQHIYIVLTARGKSYRAGNVHVCDSHSLR